MPYFVYLLGGAVLRYTIKKIGSKTVLQIGKKTFLKKSSSAAKNAVKTFRNVSYNVGGGKKVIFTKVKMEHILNSSLTPFHYMWITKGDYTNSYPLFLSKI
ncbi:hypothetical protein CX649_01415 [Bacillaceae bacterium ZC4]|nr:hypothetical protein CX649_01415 [Bacillaceae bacterium ZC4]